jgi:tRNA(Arg) A34 adenosine deaminase TadA
MKKNKQFMAEAIELALENVKNNTGGPFGAVVVKDGKIIGKSSNKVTVNNDPTAHAEIMAIREAAKNLGTFDLSDCDIYSSCEPCPMCLGAIYWARINKLYYAATKEDASKADFDDSFIYSEISKPKTQRKLQSIQMMREDAVKVFDKWIKKEDKIPY